MPNFPNRSPRDFSQYDAMDDDQLQNILREDASKPEGEESDIEMLLYVMEVLAKRRNERNEAKDPEATLASFRKNYYTGEISLASGSAPKKHGGRSHWRKGLVAAAAVLALVVGSSVTAKAFGCDFWETIVKWTQETFHFGQTDDSRNPEREDNTPYAGLQDALDKLNIHVALVPALIPEGYVESTVKIYETPKQRQYIAQYECGDKTIKICIADYLGSLPNQIEQSGSDCEIYESDGVKYYLFENNGQLCAAWIRDRFECYISGPISMTELKEMIDSIGEG